MTLENAASCDVGHEMTKILNLNAVIYCALMYSQLHPVGCFVISLSLSIFKCHPLEELVLRFTSTGIRL